MGTGSKNYSIEDHVDKNISKRFSKLALKSRESKVHQCYNVMFFDHNSMRVQYKKYQRSIKDGKVVEKIISTQW